MPTKTNKKETIKNLWAIIAQSSAVDRDSNTLSIFDILEEISVQVAGVPPEQILSPIHFQFVSLWEREKIGEAVELGLKIILRDPVGKILIENDGKLEMGPTHKRSRLRIQFQGMPITKSGTYKYEILSKEPEKTDGKELLASQAVEVKISAQPIKSPFMA